MTTAKPKPKGKNEGPLSVPVEFDEAIRRAMQVKPPPEGWPEYERSIRQQRTKRRSKAR